MSLLKHGPFAKGELVTPCCGASVKDHENADGSEAPPVEGDLSVCDRCGAVLSFNADGTLRMLTAEDWSSLPSGDVQLILKAKRVLLRRLPLMAEKRWEGQLDALLALVQSSCDATNEEMAGAAEVLGMVVQERMPQIGENPVKALADCLRTWRLVQRALDRSRRTLVED